MQALKNSLKNNSYLGYLYISITVILWGSSFVGVKACLDVFSPGALALFRSLVASLVMLMFFCWHKPKSTNINKTNVLSAMLLGMLGIGVYNVLLNYSEQTLPSSTVGFLGGQIPLVATILAIFVLKENLTKLGWLGVLISFAGIAVIAIASNNLPGVDVSHSKVSIIAMLIGVCGAGMYTSLQKLFLKDINPLSFACFAIWSSTLLLSYFFVDLINELQQADLHIIETGIYLGIFPSAIAYITWSKGVAIMPASAAANLVYFMPFATIMLSFLFLGEHVSYLTLVGGIITTLGALLNNRYGRK